LPILALAVLVGGCGRSGKAELNLLLVTLDTTRRDHLGCYGGGNLSPNFDALARDGVRFDTAIATSGATPTSHASILTGLNPPGHGVRVIYAESGYYLEKTVPTLATIIEGKSWRTGAFLSSFTVSSFYGFDRGFGTFDEGLHVPADRSFAQQDNGFWSWPLDLNQRRSDETTDEAIAWIRQVDGPFFAWVHYWDPHDAKLMPPDEVLLPFVSRDMDDDALFRGIYRAEVFFMDSQFGRLIDSLKEAGLYDNTIIVVVADHGEGLGDHGWWYHRIVYQEQIHVPLIMRVPGWPSGATVTDLVRTTDIAPTILERLGLEVPANTDGLDMSGLVHGTADGPARVAYADAINIFDLNAGMVTSRPDDALLYCAMDDEWKYIHRPLLEGRDELFHLKTDPLEQKNLFAAEPEQVQRLKSALDRFSGYVDKPFGTPTDEKVLERLKSLGYM
jgi:arylsulfatase A-like enzyme